MSCDYPIPSFAWIAFHGINYADGCGDVRVTDGSTDDDIDCDQTELSDLTLVSMAYDRTTNVLRVFGADVDVADLCDDFEPRIECGEGIGLSQMMREALTTDGSVATFRIINVTGESVECGDCADEPLMLSERIARTFVTDGADTFILIVEPGESAGVIDCDTNAVGATTIATSPLVPIGSCGMWAWRVVVDPVAPSGDFNDDFNDDFNI